MSEPAWFRSLYWRIATAFIGVVGLVLLAQALLFVWLTGRAAGALPARSPVRFAALVAADVAAALEREPELDLAGYLREQFGRSYSPVVVLMDDGRVLTNRTSAPPPVLVEAARRRLRRLQAGSEARLGRGAPRSVRRRRPAEATAIVVAQELRGVVLVPPQPRPSVIVLREMGPTLIVAGLGFLVAGTALAALVVFGPARRRLRALEEAAGAVGAGQNGVRAPETGGDEVAALARAFNRMAGDLEARARALEASDRARRQLLADVSHELSTPLTAIRGYVETLSMPDLPLDDATRQRSLTIIQEEAERLDRIVGDLLDLARLEEGGPPLAPEAVSIAALFERVEDRHRPTLAEKRVAFERRIEPGTPRVWADPGRLEQVLQNLAANAARHTPAGGRIALEASSADGEVVLRVRDSGPGVPPEHLPRIFDRFYKADASRAGAAGSGLGLSIARAIVERHGGRITAHNALEGGAVFEIRLKAGETLPAAHG